MPSFCVVLDCEQKYAHTEDVSFHRFPKEEQLLNQWKHFTGRCDNWHPSRWSAICSRHFKESDFRKCATRKVLKKNAIPSIMRGQTGNSDTLESHENESGSKNVVKVINDAGIYDCKNMENDTKESKIITFQHHLRSRNSNLVTVPETGNTLNTVSEILSIPLEIPLCVDSQNIESCNISQQDITNNDVQQYDMNLSANSSFLNFYELSTAPCRLCGQEDHITNSFLNDFEIFGMIQKCMPTLNIRQDDVFSKEVCSNCLEQLENFNAFVDQVILHQKSLMENIQAAKQIGKHPTVISSVKIKQEPIANIKVNIKQEILDTHSSQHAEGTVDDRENHFNLEQFSANEQDETFPIESEPEEQKFHLQEKSSLTTREIVKNCDIIEIINLEDGYIDIPDDEIDDQQNSIEQRNINENHPKVIDNKEIKIKKKVIEDVEIFSKENIVQPHVIQNVIGEHNYTRNCDVEFDVNLKVNEYKQEEPEDQISVNDVSTITSKICSENHDQVISNCVINKIEATNSPKKNVPIKEKLIPALKSIGNQIVCDKKTNDSVQTVNYIKIPEMSPNNYPKSSFNTDIENENSKVSLNFTSGKTTFENGLLLSNITKSKISGKSNIVVINESILKPGNVQHFELYKCLECSLQFFSLDNFNEHKKLHHSTASFDEIKTSEAICTHFCVLCETNFDSFYDLLKHRSKCRIQNSFSAKKSNKNLKNIYTCPMCLKTFVSKLALNNHRKYICKNQNGNKVICKYCGGQFRKRLLCRRHEKLCQITKTTITEKNEDLLSKTRKEDNIKIKERQSEKNENLNNNEQENFETRYNCETCNRSYARYQNLIRHKTVHRPKDEWNYKCGSCDKRFDRMHDLKIHLKSAECPCVPSKPETILFVCQICDKKFKTLQILKDHGVTHSNMCLYVCEICDKSFKAMRNLKQHKITHTSEKTVQCDLCDKTFKRLNGLLQHKRGFHLKIKPHICVVCKHAYSLKGDMLRCKHKFLSV